MSGEGDPYEVLGVSRDAGLGQVRAAFRRRALKYHPDNYRGDPAEAEAKFCRLTEAYRSVLGSLEAAAGAGWHWRYKRKYSPQDFARVRLEWCRVEAAGGQPAAQAPWLDRPVVRKRSVPRVHEPAALWSLAAVAVVLGAAGAFLAANSGLIGDVHEDFTAADAVVLWIVAAAINTAIIVAAAVVLVRTRKVVWEFLQRLFPALRVFPRDRTKGRLDG